VNGVSGHPFQSPFAHRQSSGSPSTRAISGKESCRWRRGS
jgi:hypothetical protein